MPITATPDGKRLLAPNGQRPVKRVGKRYDDPNRAGRGVIRLAERTADLLDDPSSVEDWDDEELARGRRRDRNGKFTGADPKVVPTHVYHEVVRRSIRRAQLTLHEGGTEAATVKAIQTLVAIMDSKAADEKARVAAAKIILDRGLGKESTNVEVTVRPPAFLGVIQAGLVALPSDESDIIDADVIDDDDVEWEGQ